MTCPHCATPIGEHVTEYGDHACPACGLAGPCEVLEALAARLSPAGVLEAAERLLRPNGASGPRVTSVWWHGRGVGVQCEESDDFDATTLAEAYEKLTKGDAHG